MSSAPVLLFLHGVGEGETNHAWRVALESSLTGLGYPLPGSARIIAPRYAHLLKGWDDNIPLPPITIGDQRRDAARTNRREFERRIGAVEFRLGRHDPGAGGSLNNALVDTAMLFPQFEQARNYLKVNEIRANVLDKVLASLPEEGEVVIVGHSLGSVIAADLVRRLPAGLRCAGMITIGSPLANDGFEVEMLRKSLQDPPANLAWWVNFWNPIDPVTASRGLSSVFPWLLDMRISTAPGLHVHDAATYLAHPAIASAVGYALFGSLSKDVVRVNSELDRRVDDVERMTLTALRYAYHIESQLEGDLKARYAGARRDVQGRVVESLMQRNAAQDRGTPSQVSALAFDLSDPDANAPTPLPVGYASKEDAVVTLTVLASENILRPFEIDVDVSKRRAALEDLSAEMGLGSRFGTAVFTSAEEAHRVLTRSGRINWLKWGLISAGAAAVVAATGGLALAAAPGLAGAAVVTSALAAFGPGGMIGGLITAGSLVTAGGGTIAFGLASGDTSAEVFEAVVGRQLASAILRKQQQLEPDHSVWWNLVEMEAQLRREHERVDEFSDDDAVSVKELKKKLTAVERAVTYLRANGVGYDPLAITSGSTQSQTR